MSPCKAWQFGWIGQSRFSYEKNPVADWWLDKTLGSYFLYLIDMENPRDLSLVGVYYYDLLKVSLFVAFGTRSFASLQEWRIELLGIALNCGRHL